MADGPAAHHPAQRSHARHRRRHQGRALSAPAQARLERRRDHLLLDRLRRADRLLRPGTRALRRRRQARAGRRRDHRARAGRQRAQYRNARQRRRHGIGDARVREWRYRLGEHRGSLLALVFFVLMFAIYTGNHPAGFTANVVQTAANKGVLLALVAMSQTFVVLTAGIDLSVGMVLVLTNCLASWIVLGSPLTVALGVVGVLLAGVVCGAINGIVVIYGRLQPIVTTIATGAIYFGI